jgi:hypothetical protein
VLNNYQLSPVVIMYRSARPMLASAFLKQLSPRKAAGASFLAAGAYQNKARDVSPALSTSSDFESRQRANSVKRKYNEVNSYASVTANVEVSRPDISEEVVEKVTVEVTKVKSLCEDVSSELGKIDIPPELACIINNLSEAVLKVNNVQGMLLTLLKKGGNPAPPNKQVNNGMVSLGNISKKPRSVLEPRLLPAGRADPESWHPATPATPTAKTADLVDPKVTQFKELLKEAEKSTLVFNLDMGKVPIMNKETMNKKATEALTKMAANKEKEGKNIPSEEAIMAIDDLLSVTTGMQFYGATTKSYRNPTDPKSGLYCTVPVRYEFVSRDDRIRAEKTLRDRCDVQCSTPYPLAVRECMKQIAVKVRSEKPGEMVRVTVDAGNLSFKIHSRLRTEGDEGKGKWMSYNISPPIPSSVIELGGSKKLPEGFKFEWPAPPCTPPQVITDEISMEVTSQNEGPPKGD